MTTTSDPSPNIMVLGFDMNDDEEEDNDDRNAAMKNLVFRVAKRPANTTTDTELDTTTPMKPMLWCHTDIIQDAIRTAFRTTNTHTMEDAIAALRILCRQQTLFQRTASELQSPDMIRITAVAQTVRNHRYGYRIRIENMNPGESYKLMGRTWRIVPDIEQDQSTTVNAEHGGAVGEFPVLKPFETFEYQSAVEASSSGSMEGFFHFRKVNGGEMVKVPVGPFPLQRDG